MTPAQLSLLAAAVADCDRMTVSEESRNAKERTSHTMRDIVRLDHYAARRKDIREHRWKLVALYEQLTGENPWADIPV